MVLDQLALVASGRCDGLRAMCARAPEACVCTPICNARAPVGKPGPNIHPRCYVAPAFPADRVAASGGGGGVRCVLPPPPVVSLQEAEAARVAAAAQAEAARKAAEAEAARKAAEAEAARKAAEADAARKAAEPEAARKAAEAEAARKAAEAAAGLSLVWMPPSKHCHAVCVPYVVPFRAGQLLLVVGGYMRARIPTIRTLPLLNCRCCISSHSSRRVHARLPYRGRPLCTHRAS
jgi:hypothetical protein